jgi:hypothetical protein
MCNDKLKSNEDNNKWDIFHAVSFEIIIRNTIIKNSNSYNGNRQQLWWFLISDYYTRAVQNTRGTLNRTVGTRTVGTRTRTIGTLNRTVGTRAVGTRTRTIGTRTRTIGTLNRTVGTRTRTIGTHNRTVGTRPVGTHTRESPYLPSSVLYFYFWYDITTQWI